MLTHVSSEDLAKLRAGALTPAEALRVLEHRAVCPVCRALPEVAREVGGEAAGDAVLEAFLGLDTCPSRSAEGEQRLVDFVLGRLESSASAQMVAHAQVCPECTAILEELQEDRVTLESRIAADVTE